MHIKTSKLTRKYLDSWDYLQDDLHMDAVSYCDAKRMPYSTESPTGYKKPVGAGFDNVIERAKKLNAAR